MRLGFDKNRTRDRQGVQDGNQEGDQERHKVAISATASEKTFDQMVKILTSGQLRSSLLQTDLSQREMQWGR
jgi:hypothetical protein